MKKLIEIYLNEKNQPQISWHGITRHQCLIFLKQFHDNVLIQNFLKDREEQSKIKVVKGDDAQLSKLKV